MSGSTPATPSRRAPPPSPSSPRFTSSRILSSPSLSASIYTDSGDELSDLGGSFHLVLSRDDDGSSTSTSLPDSVIGALSDTSSDHRTGSVSGDSVIGEHEEIETDNEGSFSLAGGSYTDAEATESESLLTDSRNTVSNNFPIPSDSHIRLVFPTPEASFTSSGATISDGNTPSGSLASLLPPAGDGKDATSKEAKERFDLLAKSMADKGVSQSWLQSSKLWNISPELASMVDEYRGEYAVLASTENVAAKSPFSDITAIRKNVPDMEKDFSPSVVRTDDQEARKDKAKHSNDVELENPLSKYEKPPNDTTADSVKMSRHQFRRALVNAAAVGYRAGSKKWQVRRLSVSHANMHFSRGVIALASVLSLALISTLGPGITLPLLGTKRSKESTVRPVLVPLTTDSAVPAWNVHSLVHPAIVATQFSSTPASLATSIIPDLRLISQALSTLSTTPHKESVAHPRTTDTIPEFHVEQTHGRRKLKEATESTSGSPVSIRDADVALAITTLQATTDAYKVWAQAIRRRIIKTAAEIADVNQSSPEPEVVALDISWIGQWYRHMEWLRSGIASRFGQPDKPSTPQEHHLYLKQLRSAIASVYGATDHRLASQSCQYLKQRHFGVASMFEAMYRYRHTTTARLARVYRPIQSILEETHGTAFAWSRDAWRRSFSASEPAIRRAARGAAMAQKAVSNTFGSLYHRLFTSPSKVNREAVARNAVGRARAALETLSDYVEEQSSAVQEKSIGSLKQAKQGLNKLIDKFGNDGEARTQTTNGEEPPMPFGRMRRGRTGRMEQAVDRRRMWLSQCRRGRAHEAKSYTRQEIPKSEKVKRSRGAALIEHIHHAAVQLVI